MLRPRVASDSTGACPDDATIGAIDNRLLATSDTPDDDLDDVRSLERAMRRRFPRLGVRVFGYSYPVVMFWPRFSTGATKPDPISLHGVNIHAHDEVGTAILLAAYEGLR